jgi:adenosyl cobinamide kinase/adenosyl cobinamide phosphate guanylyltransferase
VDQQSLIRHDDKYASAKVEELIEKLPQLIFICCLSPTRSAGVSFITGWRKFRDLAGSTNQHIAQAANEVI